MEFGVILDFLKKEIFLWNFVGGEMKGKWDLQGNNRGFKKTKNIFKELPKGKKNFFCGTFKAVSFDFFSKYFYGPQKQYIF